MKVGDMVKYRGWSKSPERTEPLALVIEQRNPESSFHHRIQVMWIVQVIPVQAQVLSLTPPGRISAWIIPKYFEVVESPELEIDDDPDRIWRLWGDQ